MAHNWFVNQDIVCIETHPNGFVKEGEVYTIESLRASCCGVDIHIGKYDDEGYDIYTTVCSICGGERSEWKSNIIWLGEHRFASLDTLTDISEIEEILSQPIETLFQL